MRKLGLSLLVVSIILLMVSPSSAQNSRDGTSSEGKTTFTNIGVRGLNKDGTSAIVDPGLPGYIEMTSTAGNVFYLYIDYDGILRIASDAVIGRGASPNIVSWGGAASAPTVGQQTD